MSPGQFASGCLAAGCVQVQAMGQVTVLSILSSGQPFSLTCSRQQAQIPKVWPTVSGCGHHKLDDRVDFLYLFIFIMQTVAVLTAGTQPTLNLDKPYHMTFLKIKIRWR